MKNALSIMAFLVVALIGTLAADKLIEFAASYHKLTLLEPSALSRLSSWLLAWQVFGGMFQPVFSFAMRALYPGSGYAN